MGPNCLSAAPIATPTPGSGAILSPTVPNPTQFNFAPGTVGSSSQINSNFYGVESQIFAIVAGLNGCTWIPSAAIGSISVTAPIIASLGSCAANSGTGVNLSLSLSSTLPATVFSGLISANAGISSGGQTTIFGSPAALINYGGGGSSGLSVYNGGTTTLGPLNAGAATFAGLVSANAGITSTGQTTLYGNPAALVNYNGGGPSGLSIYNGATALGLLTAGPILGTANGTATSYVPPLFLSAGGSAAITSHSVIGSCAFAGGFSCGVSFGASVGFTSATTYACHADYGAGTATASNDSLSIDSKTAIAMRIVNAGTSGGAAYTGTVAFECTGY